MALQNKKIESMVAFKPESDLQKLLDIREPEQLLIWNIIEQAMRDLCCDKIVRFDRAAFIAELEKNNPPNKRRLLKERERDHRRNLRMAKKVRDDAASWLENPKNEYGTVLWYAGFVSDQPERLVAAITKFCKRKNAGKNLSAFQPCRSLSEKCYLSSYMFQKSRANV